MEEIVLKQSKAQYFMSATKVVEGFLILTNKRIVYSGTQVRVQLSHGAAGNLLRDKMEKMMGYNVQEESIFDIPLEEVEHCFKRYGLSKRLAISNRHGHVYKLLLSVKKAERDEWPAAIDEAKRTLVEN